LAEKFKPFKTSGNWLDVGCGNGHLLAVAKTLGWNVYGTEFTDEAVAICRNKGISMQQGELDLTHYQAGSFDVITFIEVIEHINSPIRELSFFHSLLKKGGALYITTPNFNSVSRYILGEKWKIIEYPEHLCYYTPKTLNAILEDQGFEKVEMITSGISFRRLSKSIKNEFSSNQDIEDEALRKVTENSAIANRGKKFANHLLNLFNAGETLKALYIKK
jgi:2-polyprenyl-3-methyl-5-hydroxy-6-metoxy-1,4-benzoquinol methylase